MADIVSPAQEATLVRRKIRNPGVLMGGYSIPGLGSAAPPVRIVSRHASSIETPQQPAHGQGPRPEIGASTAIGRWAAKPSALLGQ